MLVAHLLKTKKEFKNYLEECLDKAGFKHDMAYGKYKDLTKGTQSDKVSRDKAFKNF